MFLTAGFVQRTYGLESYTIGPAFRGPAMFSAYRAGDIVSTDACSADATGFYGLFSADNVLATLKNSHVLDELSFFQPGAAPRCRHRIGLAGIVSPNGTGVTKQPPRWPGIPQFVQCAHCGYVAAGSQSVAGSAGPANSEVAYRLPFEDLSYFARFFKKHTGLNPTDYRQQA